VLLRRGGAPSRLWIYLPERPATAKLPCLLIAPAGTPLFHGMALGDGDRPEHLPYVKAGYAVVAYELDGPLRDNAPEREVIAAARAFQRSEAGVENARAAIRYLRERVPAIDPNRIYPAGHSSAGTLSLLVAERLPGIRGCIAYAPVAAVPARLGEEAVATLDRVLPGYRVFLQQSSPDTHAARLRCPTFLFHADDDNNVPRQEVTDFATLLRRTNPRVTLVNVPAGGHYDSMIRQGIPLAIQWLQRLPPGEGAPR
jgi:dipeptidyl aminopeptidase/acylaminoacyl peptidase